jgi:uncharacterized membrane protein YbaN (DUF454 family)
VDGDVVEPALPADAAAVDPHALDPGAALDAVFALPSRPVRVVLLSAGTLGRGLGVVALVLPLIPSTPFLLIAAACYARASERLYRWLIAQPAIGRIIVEWQATRTIAPDVRRSAMLTVVISFGVSILVIDSLIARAVLLVLGLIVLWILSRIPTSPEAA